MGGTTSGFVWNMVAVAASASSGILSTAARQAANTSTPRTVLVS
jgi:translation elongation factor EF-Tu-like GTPase